MSKILNSCFAAALAIALLPAHGSDKNSDGGSSVEAGKHAFLKQKARIEKDIAKGDRYREISDADRKTVLSLLDRMAERLEPVSDPSELSEKAMIELFNDQEHVNTLLTAAREDSRLICEKRTTMGSNMRRTVCETVAQRNRLREQQGDWKRLQFEKSFFRDSDGNVGGQPGG